MKIFVLCVHVLYIYIYIWVYPSPYTYVYIFNYIYICFFIYSFIFSFIHIHTHTHTRTYIYKNIYMDMYAFMIFMIFMVLMIFHCTFGPSNVARNPQVTLVLAMGPSCIQNILQYPTMVRYFAAFCSIYLRCPCWICHDMPQPTSSYHFRSQGIHGEVDLT